MSVAMDGVAVVTGGAGTGAGLGRSLVTQLAERGMAVAVLDVDLDAATALAAEICGRGGDAVAVPVDLLRPETLDDAAAAVRARFGACNVLCAHAAAGIDPLAPDLWSPDVWRQAMEGIVVGTAATVHAFLPLVRDSAGRRTIVFTASAVALGVGRFQGPYRAAKTAVVSLAETLALELEPEGIDVTIALPNGITGDAPAATGSGAERAQQALADALAGLDLPDEIVARFLAIGEEMAADPTDLADGGSIAATILDAVSRRRRYVVTHGASAAELHRGRQAELDRAFEDLAGRGHAPLPDARRLRPSPR